MVTALISARLRWTRRVARAACAVFLCLAVHVPAASGQSDEALLEEPGIKSSRAYFSEQPWESIDAYSGSLVLTFTDLVLPGNAGFDLRFTRTYNSKGAVRWRLGPGLVHHADLVEREGAPPKYPIVVSADGTEEQTFGTGISNVFRTASHAEYQRWPGSEYPPQLRRPDGVVVTYGCLWNTDDRNVRYPTLAVDAYGNTLEYSYQGCGTAQAPLLMSITQNLGQDQSRIVQFTYYPGATLLHWMTYAGRQWTYTWSGNDLESVVPPVGPGWLYGYSDQDPTNTARRLDNVVTPNGGTVHYGYLWSYEVVAGRRPTIVVSERHAFRRNGVQEGAWYFTDYAGDSTVIEAHTNPDNLAATTSTTTYRFDAAYPYFGRPGIVSSVETRQVDEQGSTLLETESYGWVPGATLGVVDPSIELATDNFTPLLRNRVVTRGSRTWATDYYYRDTDFKDYGHPQRVTETGELIRSVDYTYKHDFTPYVRGKVKKVTVTGNVTGVDEQYETTREYDVGTGFMTKETVYGLSTDYLPTDRGNVWTETDAQGHATTYSYLWATPSQIVTPEYTIARVINPDGTIQSETRRGYTTTFQYDALGRESLRQPPGGVPAIHTDYDRAWTRVTRGTFWSTTLLDGFGRPSGTEDVLGVKTTVSYDGAGRKTYQSYPYQGTTGTSHPGVTYTYDALDRVVATVAQPDPAYPQDTSETVTTEYRTAPNHETRITDAKGHLTVQTWKAFGSPDRGRLASVLDARGHSTTYTYYLRGQLKSVSPGPRAWTYKTSGQVESETHPELGPASAASGTVTYGYTNGRLTSRTDAHGTTTYVYDDNDRLTLVDKPGSVYDTHYEYDESDNRTVASNGHVSSQFDYDPANRLIRRTDRIDGHAFVTAFSYDESNGELNQVVYPSGRRVDYEVGVNPAGRITAVHEDDVLLADQFSYDLTGALDSYHAANGGTHTVDRDTRGRVRTVNAASEYHVTLHYDPAGNVDEVDDKTAHDHDQILTYDDIDRLGSVSGFGAMSFTHDDRGNRLTKNVNSSTVTYHYDTVGKQRLMSTTGAETRTFSYDDAGNMTNDGSGNWQYTYTPDNQLREATFGGQVVASYEYDADGVRTVTRTAGTATYHLHGQGLETLSVATLTDGRLRFERDYFFAGDRLIASTTSTPAGAPPQPPAAPAPTGRYKLDGSGYCYWDPNDSGLNQCTPQLPGRYKLDSEGTCYWEPNDTGANQCTPPPGRYELDAGGNCVWNYAGTGADQCTPAATSGRYKTDGAGGCYWDPTDSGPNQCVPASGRYKIDGEGTCYWDPNDQGADQCGPNYPAPSAVGRFKWSGTYCYWDPNDDGPDQCWPGGPAPSTYPSVSLTSPASGATFITPGTITLTANATDPNGTVARVEFLNGSTVLATDTVAPFTYTWSSVPTGTYTLRARATDNDGARTTSAAATVTVGPPPNALPTVALTRPSSGTIYYAPKLITVSATASDSDGTITQVVFYANGTRIAADTTAPYSVTWSVSATGAGTYNLVARAHDNAGGVKQSAGITVTIRPPTGRYKLDGNGNCYWDPNDSGSNQCMPEDPGEEDEEEELSR
ncbi:MAG: Ig-like domain-containing protein [Phycisphaerae bacterium]|nr:Ig-like domain-containing protein [Phycisphaerae bacterium]